MWPRDATDSNLYHETHGLGLSLQHLSWENQAGDRKNPPGAQPRARHDLSRASLRYVRWAGAMEHVSCLFMVGNSK